MITYIYIVAKDVYMSCISYGECLKISAQHVQFLLAMGFFELVCEVTGLLKIYQRTKGRK